MKPVTWGVLSVASHFVGKINTNVRKSPLNTIQAIASRNLDKARAAAARLGIPRAYGSYADLLADKEIEAVYIPLPDHLHAEWVKKAADAGKHVLCEKPFAMTAAEAQETFDYAKRKGVLVMESLMYRFHPQWIRAGEIVRSGELGEIHAVTTFFSYTITDPANIRNILEVGGGGMRDVGSYAVSAARFLIGAEPTRVVSLMHRDPSLKTDTLSTGMLDFGKARSTFTVATQTQAWQQVDAVGAGGHLTIHLPFNANPDTPAEITVTAWNGTRKVYTPVSDQFVEVFDAFSRAVRGGGPVPQPPEDTVNNQKALDALFRSEKSGTWEPVR
ncbi:MAG TPA: Gfo/Idh/MocA family oxidoreductase [Spirochaetia bacterium]|nr:Gfo/Idh/MocA family oxidoreductase [Spirochaetia bacterium]